MIGSNKIVATNEDVQRRTNEYSLELESARVRVDYKIPGSMIVNHLTINGSNPMFDSDRFHFIIVKKALGFRGKKK